MTQRNVTSDADKLAEFLTQKNTSSATVKKLIDYLTDNGKTHKHYKYINSVLTLVMATLLDNEYKAFEFLICENNSNQNQGRFTVSCKQVESLLKDLK